MKIRHNKLVRDKILQVIIAAGGKPKSRTLNKDEYKLALIAKLDEEVAEFKADLSLGELADVQEVILALVVMIGETPRALEASRAAKATRRGTFKDKIFLEYVEA